MHMDVTWYLSLDQICRLNNVVGTGHLSCRSAMAASASKIEVPVQMLPALSVLNLVGLN